MGEKLGSVKDSWFINCFSNLSFHQLLFFYYLISFIPLALKKNVSLPSTSLPPTLSMHQMKGKKTSHYHKHVYLPTTSLFSFFFFLLTFFMCNL